VDGQVYSQAVTLNWVAGSKHLLVFLTDPPLPNSTTTSSCQTSVDGSTVFCLTGWKDNAGLLQPTSDPVQTITANPQITTITAGVQVSYRVMLNFFAAPDATLPVTCGAPGAIPAGIFRPGLVFLNGTCYWATANVLVPANSQLALNAFPYPGFVFIGWALNSGAPNAYLTSLTVTSPMTIAPQFSPGKRVHFLTNPLGLNVLVDHTTSPTRTDTNVTGPCPFNEQEPVYPGTGFPPVCFGDFDFAPSSTHVISGVSPQIDAVGNYWVFSKWSNGTGPNAVYTVDSNTASSDTLTGTFVPGAHVGFLTNPTGLALNIDNRQNWPGYNFIWGLGETHTVTAAATQSDSKGRKYTFQSWSNTGAATQTVTVDQSAVSNGLLLIANYSVLSRILIQSYPTGMAVQVDGTSCLTPCNIDRPSGAKVRVTAQTQVGMGPSARLDFNNWSDGGPSDHTYTVTGDYAVLIASYTNSYQLNAISDPANGVSFQFSPSSSDMFYSEGTQVSVTAAPNNGFKFRRWNGDLSGTYPSGTITMYSEERDRDDGYSSLHRTCRSSQRSRRYAQLHCWSRVADLYLRTESLGPDGCRASKSVGASHRRCDSHCAGPDIAPALRFTPTDQRAGAVRSAGWRLHAAGPLGRSTGCLGKFQHRPKLAWPVRPKHEFSGLRGGAARGWLADHAG